MKLLTYQPGFINDLVNNDLVNNNLVNNDLVNNDLINNYQNNKNKNKLDDLLLFDGYYFRKKIYVNVKIMGLGTTKILDEYDSSVKEMIINQCSILGLLDLKKFTNIKKLICSSNEIMRIVNLPETLEYLDVSFNSLKSINIENLKNLKYLKCSHNQLEQIILPYGIEFFDCSSNNFYYELTELNKLINLNTLILSFNGLNKINIVELKKLKKLEIVDNRIKNISNIPDSLEYLDCSYNLGINFNFELPEQLKILNCSNCNLNKLNNLPPSLNELVCSHNQITRLDNLPCGLKTLYCRNNLLTNLDYLPDSLEVLFCGDNKNISNLDNLNSGLKELECKKLECKKYHGMTNFKNLPNNLNYLAFSLYDVSNIDLNNLPISIKWVNIEIIDSSENYQSLQFEKIPNFIDQLEISFYFDNKYCSKQELINKILQNSSLELKDYNNNYKNKYIFVKKN